MRVGRRVEAQGFLLEEVHLVDLGDATVTFIDGLLEVGHCIFVDEGVVGLEVGFPLLRAILEGVGPAGLCNRMGGLVRIHSDDF